MQMFFHFIHRLDVPYYFAKVNRRCIISTRDYVLELILLCHSLGQLSQQHLGISRSLLKHLERLPQFLDLIRILSKQGVLRILVDLGLVLDVLGSSCISKGGQCLIIVVVSGRQGGNHDGLSVSTEGVL